MSRNYPKENRSRRPSTIRLAIASLALVAAIACGGSSPTSPTPPNPPDPPAPTAPSIACPATISTGSTNGSPVPVMYTVPTANGGVDPVTVSCTPAPGAPFPIGTTTVQCTATGSNGQTAVCSFSVTVTPPVPRLADTSFLAFGDSMTLGEVTSPVATTSDAEGFRSFKLQIVPTAAYPRQLQLLLAARYTQQTVQVANFGVAGESATNGKNRFPGVVANAKPRVVLLMEGANDLNLLGAAGISGAVAAMESMAKEARFRGARVFVATLPPPRPSGKNALPATTVQAYNSRLASMAFGEGATLVDVYSALLSGANIYIGNDGLHPTEAGYQKIAETFYNAIRTTMEVRLQP